VKLGVLTYFGVPNFGAQLQALSTVGFLQRKGHEALVLNWYPNDLRAMYARRVPSAQIQRHDAFTASMLPITMPCRNEEELVRVIDENDFDGLIHGSDALFKYEPEKTRRHFRARKLRFEVQKVSLVVEGIEGNPFWGHYVASLKKRIPASVYAVSSQHCPFQLLTLHEKRALRKGLKNFAGISVRDEWTRQMVHAIMGKEYQVDINPDPVFAFNQNCGSKVPSKEDILRRFGLPDHYVLFSFWTTALKNDYVTRIAEELKKHGLTSVALPMPERLIDFGLEYKVQLPLDTMDWYALIKYADGYIGERMHPIVVAIHNAVPFFSFDEYGMTTADGFHPESSKTFLIVKDSGLLDSYYAYQSKAELPSPESVVRVLLNFDRKKCEAFATEMQRKYEKGMDDLIDLFR